MELIVPSTLDSQIAALEHTLKVKKAYSKLTVNFPKGTSEDVAKEVTEAVLKFAELKATGVSADSAPGVGEFSKAEVEALKVLANSLINKKAAPVPVATSETKVVKVPPPPSVGTSPVDKNCEVIDLATVPRAFRKAINPDTVMRIISAQTTAQGVERYQVSDLQGSVFWLNAEEVSIIE